MRGLLCRHGGQYTERLRAQYTRMDYKHDRQIEIEAMSMGRFKSILFAWRQCIEIVRCDQKGTGYNCVLFPKHCGHVKIESVEEYQEAFGQRRDR